MAGGGGGGNTWIIILVAGLVLIGIAMGVGHSAPTWVHAGLLAVGGLAVVFGSCEAMILSVDGLGKRLDWNEFVAGTMAGLASNVPEVVMLGFVISKDPRVGFVVVALTLHVGALAFGGYAALLPRDETGQARLPLPMVKLSTDLYASAGVIYLAMGMLMVTMHTFDHGDHSGEGLGAGDLYMIGAVLLMVEVVAVWRLVKRFAKAEPSEQAATPAGAAATPAGAAKPPEGEPRPPEGETADASPADAEEIPSVGRIAFFGVLGVGMSVIGGHAVGDFADALVKGLTGAGFSKMVGAIILSVFACAGVFLMLAMSHMKGKYEIALSNASGAVTQVPFVVLPIALIMMAAFAQGGIIPTLPHGGVLPIDFETTAVVFFGFPTMLILWKSIQDDGTVNWVETASMIALFVLIIYMLAAHGKPT